MPRWLFCIQPVHRPAGQFRAGFLCDVLLGLNRRCVSFRTAGTKASLREVASTVSAQRSPSREPEHTQACSRSGIERGRFDSSATSRSDRTATQVGRPSRNSNKPSRQAIAIGRMTPLTAVSKARPPSRRAKTSRTVGRSRAGRGIQMNHSRLR